MGQPPARQKAYVQESIQVTHKKSVNRVVHGIEQNKSIPISATSSTPNLLPCRHYAGRKSSQNDAIQSTNVEPQLQSVGREYDVNVTRFDFLLNVLAVFIF